MHGADPLIAGWPALCLDEMIDEDTENRHRWDIEEKGTVIINYSDEDKPRPVILSGFFRNHYTQRSFNRQMIYAQCCAFFGCDCDSTEINERFADALLDCGAEVVVGYHNSVNSVYGRNVMNSVVKRTFNGATVQEAVDTATNIYGETDGDTFGISHKFEAFPHIMGNENFVLRPSGVVAGRVMNATDNSPVENALVRVYRHALSLEYTRTDANGDYRIDSLVPGEYIVKITAGGYSSIKFAVTVMENEVTYNATTMLMHLSDMQINEANGVVNNSITAKGVGDVTVKMRKNWNNKNGTVLYTTTTNANGYYHINYQPGYYTLELSKEGFTTGYKNIVIGNAILASQDVTISPVLSEGAYRIVLTWGENPNDLDAHVEGELSDGDSFHVYYRNKSCYDGEVEVCNLDVDDTSSYGPETITLVPTTAEPYYYYIHHFNGSESIATSNAQINVYKGDQLLRTFNAPTNPDERFFYWNVFAIKNGELIVSNTITSFANTYYAG